ncbi:G2/M phase-specific E3 ubiquitin-protein ligase-like isoform X2 [Salvelinus namaycush]|uniref:G2/M phase-specific E3 ubiquitin-protein ligase-like isoform X2 n=1 Tax=Salvelinus namaycush TaxID=8040 RepID=A0A8U1EXW6_SALNM|nr:G2/M phase-specific E3 ubiquitin-protein ligase-like isoform X2 [Salvelinus namaycush]
MNISAILRTLWSRVDQDHCPIANMINVHRGNVLNSSLYAFQRKNFNAGAKMDVAFVDVESKAEGAVDQGGPSREYYRLLRDSAIFEGPEGAKWLSLDVHASHEGLYGTIGKMISVCVVHGGVGPHFSERLFAAVCGNPAPPLSLEEVSHTTLRAHLENIKKAEDLSEVKNKLEESVDWLSLLGLTRIVVKTMEDRDGVVELVAQQFVHGSMQVALEQLKYGLNSFGPLFVDSIKPPTARDLRDLFTVTYSIPCGNRRCLENDTICHWFNWLAEVQVVMVFEFATGATVVPPLGFEDTATIEFLHKARGRLAGQQKKTYPEANTCAVTLRLPLHSTYNTTFRCWIKTYFYDT